MTSRHGGTRSARRWLLVGAAAALLGAGVRAEDGTEDMAATPADGDEAEVNESGGGTGSAAAGDGIDGSAGSRVDSPATVSPIAAPASDPGSNGFDDVRELSSGNTGGRG